MKLDFNKRPWDRLMFDLAIRDRISAIFARYSMAAPVHSFITDSVLLEMVEPGSLKEARQLACEAWEDLRHEERLQ
jgi:hypothetical protein